MKKYILPLLFVSLLAASCTPGNKGQNASDVPVTRKEMQSEVVKTVANLTIEGMTCSEGCGGKIQKELQALKGVKTTDLDFAESRPQNVVSVEFNSAEISEQDMIKCVASIMDGKYQVKSVEVVQYKGLQGTGGSASHDAGVSTEGSLSNVFDLLNLLQSITHLVK